MAVPKKRTSVAKTRIRKAAWFAAARVRCNVALLRGQVAFRGTTRPAKSEEAPKRVKAQGFR